MHGASPTTFNVLAVIQSFGLPAECCAGCAKLSNRSVDWSGRVTRVLGIIQILIFTVVVMGCDQGDTNRVTHKPVCEKSLQTTIDAADAGATIQIPEECVYRETVTVNKSLTLKAKSGAEIRGSDIWNGWQKSGKYWMKGSLPTFQAHGRCRTSTERCILPEQVFFDGKPLFQVQSQPKSGQFAVDEKRRVILADNPANHTVEVTTRTHWVVGSSNKVTIKGFAMKHAAIDAQSGAIMNRLHFNDSGFSDWIVQNNNLSYAHGGAISLAEGTGLKIIGNNVHHNGQHGIASYESHLLVQGNKIHHNNTEDFDPGWEAGGMKSAFVRSLKVDNNEVYNNNGPGLWCDIHCKQVTYSNNRIHNNERMGILYEISEDATISGNVVWENGFGKPEWGWGAGILSSSSKEVEIYDNVLAWNADGISIVSADRTSQNAGTVNDVSVRNNIILAGDDLTDGEDQPFALAWLQDWNGVLYRPSSNNHGIDNRYWYPKPEEQMRFSWETPFSNLSNFNSTPGEQSGRYLTNTQKDKVISSADIPAYPTTR